MNKLLVTDDEEILRMLIVDTLEDEGFDIDEASDGEEALSFLEQKEYALLILDYMMPKLTGLDVLKKVRANPVTSNQKVLMLTAKGQAQDKQEMLDNGADSILIKPFSPKELVETVKDLIDASQNER
ncbi:response regulator transcription factor [Halalkalibacter akibai]|uniref:Two-component response regulator n=1 Tax=Halalkalibacter akibai (strain ATCC 43226 / DSM 21942 / CIP 109018 / JCM 9157 / 1139) TaxID=1236973 RepID=W4QQD6_HALA3|nr:response regulator [Halalkalibacter akibai]GAE33539.1 two-component response regulator [Halalkalibacter akibai JCM 9157]